MRRPLASTAICAEPSTCPAGWNVTRVPTIVRVSPNVTAGEVLFSLVAFTLLYGALMVADVYLLDKYAKAGIHGPEPKEAPFAAHAARA